MLQTVVLYYLSFRLGQLRTASAAAAGLVDASTAWLRVHRGTGRDLTQATCESALSWVPMTKSGHPRGRCRHYQVSTRCDIGRPGHAWTQFAAGAACGVVAVGSCRSCGESGVRSDRARGSGIAERRPGGPRSRNTVVVCLCREWLRASRPCRIFCCKPCRVPNDSPHGIGERPVRGAGSV